MSKILNWIRKIYYNWCRTRAFDRVCKAAGFFEKQSRAFLMLKFGQSVSYGGDYGCGSTYLAAYSAALIALQNKGCRAGLFSDSYRDSAIKFEGYFNIFQSMKLGFYSKTRMEFIFKKKYGGSRILLIHANQPNRYRSMELQFVAVDCSIPQRLAESIGMILQRVHRPNACALVCNYRPKWPLMCAVRASRVDNPHLSQEFHLKMSHLPQREIAEAGVEL